MAETGLPVGHGRLAQRLVEEVQVAVLSVDAHHHVGASVQVWATGEDCAAAFDDDLLSRAEEGRAVWADGVGEPRDVRLGSFSLRVCAEGHQLGEEVAVQLVCHRCVDHDLTILSSRANLQTDHLNNAGVAGYYSGCNELHMRARRWYTDKVTNDG